MSLKQKLIDAVQLYLKANNSPFSFFNGMGKKGKERADAYLKFLQNSELDEHTLYYTVLTHIQSQLDTSTNLRNYLAETLCAYRDIPRATIDREADTIFAGNIAMNGYVLKAQDDCRTDAMIKLLVQQPTLAQVPTTPSPSL